MGSLFLLSDSDELMDMWGKYDRKYSMINVETNALVTARELPKVRWFHFQVFEQAY